MPGGAGAGVIFDAISKLKSNRSLRTSKKDKFKGNYSGDTILKPGGSEKIEFPKLPEEQVKSERERIRERHESRRFREKLKWSLLVVIALASISFLYYATDGFEYWEDVLPY